MIARTRGGGNKVGRNSPPRDRLLGRDVFPDQSRGLVEDSADLEQADGRPGRGIAPLDHLCIHRADPSPTEMHRF